MPALPPYLIEPIWQQFSALLPEHRTDHPLGCHRSRIPERVVFEKLVQVLVLAIVAIAFSVQGFLLSALPWLEQGYLPVIVLAFPIFSRFTDRYYAAVVATVFLAVTTGWGPVGMSYLRRFTDEEGEVEPMPDILPLNAFFVFPWTAILLTASLIRLFG